MVLVAQARKFIAKNSIFSVCLGFFWLSKERLTHPEGISDLRRTELFSHMYSISFFVSL